MFSIFVVYDLFSEDQILQDKREEFWILHLEHIALVL